MKSVNRFRAIWYPGPETRLTVMVKKPSTFTRGAVGENRGVALQPWEAA